jgi:mannonate dehydratase
MKTPTPDHLTRRTFNRLAAAVPVAGMAAKRPLEQWEPGIKISLQIPTDPAPDDLQFVQQLGVKWVNIPTGGPRATYETFAALRQRVETAGLRVWNIGNSNVHNMPEVTLNLPGRDEKIEEYKQYLRNLARAGIYYTTYAHMGNGIWSSERETTRGGAPARALDISKNPKGYWGSKTFEAPLSHGRRFTEQEIWDNYAYFIKQVVPVAEELGIRIGIHPDDPPQPEIAGVPRCIFSSFEGYKKALEIADSPNIGMCLCVGCWLEGGPLMGKDVVETIKYFGSRKKLFKVHFRNVSAPLPHFTETLMDDGYYDMYKVMKAMVDVNFEGIAIPDHIPGLGYSPAPGGQGRGSGGGGFRPNAGLAYCIGYMNALLKAVQSEKGKA